MGHKVLYILYKSHLLLRWEGDILSDGTTDYNSSGSCLLLWWGYTKITTVKPRKMWTPLGPEESVLIREVS